jgi:phosphoribosylaminoimidazole-succinocarboxamide synthase
LSRGIIIADTKFELGWFEGELILIDEVLTPDSSRFWPLDQYAPGKGQPSFDKQFLRDYLSSLDWDKKPPPPELPDEILAKTGARYAEAVERIIGS